MSSAQIAEQVKAQIERFNALKLARGGADPDVIIEAEKLIDLDAEIVAALIDEAQGDPERLAKEQPYADAYKHGARAEFMAALLEDGAKAISLLN